MTDGVDPTPRESQPPAQSGAPRGMSPSQPPAGQGGLPESGSPPMHPSLVPTGEHVAHSAIGSLVGGVLVWGAVGVLLDHWLDTGRVLTAVGVVLGFLTGFVIVYVRFGRDE